MREYVERLTAADIATTAAEQRGQINLGPTRKPVFVTAASIRTAAYGRA
ncbi:hypothetical protein X737_26370 [Mesorhizobium sp. L48C026A00]|nr:hypothetical protein X737_26370 [Mesorhizobium sp. L48C026A00]